MGERLGETQRRRAAAGGPSGRPAGVGVSGIVVLLGLLGLGLLVAALVVLHPVAVGPLLVIGSALLWWYGNRRQPVDAAEHGRAAPATPATPPASTHLTPVPPPRSGSPSAPPSPPGRDRLLGNQHDQELVAGADAALSATERGLPSGAIGSDVARRRVQERSVKQRFIASPNATNEVA